MMLLKYGRRRHIRVISRARGLSWYRRHLPGFSRSLYLYADGHRDGSVFNEAIESLPNNPGGKVTASEGPFGIDIPVAPKSFTTLEGPGPSAVLRAVDGLNSHVILPPPGAHDILVQYLKIDGNGANQTPSARGFSTDASVGGEYNIHLYRLTIVDTADDGAHFRKSVKRSSIVECLASGCGGDSFQVSDGSEDILFADDVAYLGGETGFTTSPFVAVTGSALKRITFRGNRAIKCGQSEVVRGDGYRFEGVHDGFMYGNWAFECGRAGAAGGYGFNFGPFSATLNTERVLLGPNYSIHNMDGGFSIGGAHEVTGGRLYSYQDRQALLVGAAAGFIPTDLDVDVYSVLADQYSVRLTAGLRPRIFLVSLDPAESVAVDHVRATDVDGLVLLPGSKLRDRRLVQQARDGVLMEGTSDNFIMDGVDFRVYGTRNAVTEVGANNTIRRNLGYITENNVLSDTFLIDGVALRTVTIAHGLDVTPSLEDCQLTVVEETNVDDWGYDLLKVESVDAVNVVAKIHVSVASATGAATARLLLRVARA